MLTQADFEIVCNTEIVSLVTSEVSGKARTDSEVATGIKLFIQNAGGDLSLGVQSGVTHRGYLFTDQLAGRSIKINDKFKIGATTYEVVSDGELMNQNKDFEPFYKLNLEKRIAL